MKFRTLSTLLFLILLSTNLSAGQKINASIVELDYVMPENFTGPAGSVIFDTVKIQRDDMMVILENDDEVFDSEIFIRNKFLGFKGKYHSFGFIFNSESFLGQVEAANIKNAQFDIDDNRLNFYADHFMLDVEKAGLTFDNSRLFCLKEQKLANNTENLIYGCLNNISFTPNFVESDARVQFDIEGLDETQKITLIGDLKNFEMGRDRIKLQTTKSRMKMLDNEIEIDDFSFICPKSYIEPPFDVNTIIKECFDDAKFFNENKNDIGINLKSDIEGKSVSFNSNIRSLDIKEQTLNFVSLENTFSMLPLVARSSKLDINCKKDIDLEGEMASILLKGCLNNLRLSENIWVMEDKDLKSRYYLNFNKAFTTPTELSFDIINFQKVNKIKISELDIVKGTMSIFEIKGTCLNNNTFNNLELGDAIDNCLKMGRVTIASMVDSENKKLEEIYSSYNGAINDFTLFKNLNPFEFVRKDKPMIKTILIDFNENYMSFKGKYKFMGSFRNIKLAGPIKFNRETSELEIKMKKVKLPVPLLGRATWFASWILKKFLSSGTIRVKKKTIYIKIGSQK